MCEVFLECCLEIFSGGGSEGAGREERKQREKGEDERRSASWWDKQRRVWIWEKGVLTFEGREKPERRNWELQPKNAQLREIFSGLVTMICTYIFIPHAFLLSLLLMLRWYLLLGSGYVHILLMGFCWSLVCPVMISSWDILHLCFTFYFDAHLISSTLHLSSWIDGWNEACMGSLCSYSLCPVFFSTFPCFWYLVMECPKSMLSGWSLFRVFYIRIGGHNWLPMIQNITNPLKCHPQRTSKDISWLLHLSVPLLHHLWYHFLFGWLSFDAMEKFKTVPNSPRRASSYPPRQGMWLPMLLKVKQNILIKFPRILERRFDNGSCLRTAPYMRSGVVVHSILFLVSIMTRMRRWKFEEDDTQLFDLIPFSWICCPQ